MRVGILLERVVRQRALRVRRNTLSLLSSDPLSRCARLLNIILDRNEPYRTSKYPSYGMVLIEYFARLTCLIRFLLTGILLCGIHSEIVVQPVPMHSEIFLYFCSETGGRVLKLNNVQIATPGFIVLKS